MITHCRNRPPSGLQIAAILSTLLIAFATKAARGDDLPPADDVAARIASQGFHPLNDEGTFTLDRHLKTPGVADLSDTDGVARLIAIRDLVRLLPADSESVIGLLDHNDLHVRQIAAAALGIAAASESVLALEERLREDTAAIVRSQAAMSLGQIKSVQSLSILQNFSVSDPSDDVRHQCELAAGQITSLAPTDPLQLEAFRDIDPESFDALRVGSPAPNFTLNDTRGRQWDPARQGADRWVVLIWIFADWCPVCHREFSELIETRERFEDANIAVATVECHDRFRTRVMTGENLQPTYWFSKDSFGEHYRQGIWWPHLSDPAGAIGAKFGVSPMAFAVHGEYVNRPSTIIIDPQGVCRFAYYGTYWGDRPSIAETLKMVEDERFDFQHPKRLAMPSP